MTDRLVEEVSDEIRQGRPVQLVDQPLIKAQAKDYVRQTQERLIGEPILQQVRAEHGDDGAEQRLLALLDGWRNRPEVEQGYGPGNVVNLLRLQRGDLRGLDIGRLTLRQAYLAGIEAQDTSLAGAHLAGAVLAEAFNFPFAVALSGDGAFLAAGTSEGEVRLWRVADRTPLLAIQGHTGAVYAVALSADGRWLSSSSQDGTVRLWGTPSASPGRDEQFAARRAASAASPALPESERQLLATLQGHTSGVHGVALSENGRLLASSGQDGTVRLWEPTSGACLHTLRNDRRYERLDITGLTGVTAAQRAALLALGAVDHAAMPR